MKAGEKLVLNEIQKWLNGVFIHVSWVNISSGMPQMIIYSPGFRCGNVLVCFWIESWCNFMLIWQPHVLCCRLYSDFVSPSHHFPRDFMSLVKGPCLAASSWSMIIQTQNPRRNQEQRRWHFAWTFVQINPDFNCILKLELNILYEWGRVKCFCMCYIHL